MSKDHLFAFRCDDQIAELLEGEENRSETIIRALREHFRREFAVTCPTCEGTGQVYNPIRGGIKEPIRALKPRPVKEKRYSRVSQGT